MELTKKELGIFIFIFALIALVVWALYVAGIDRSQFSVLSCTQEDDKVVIEVSFLNKGDCARAPNISFRYKATQDGITYNHKTPTQKTFNNNINVNSKVKFKIYFDTEDIDPDRQFLFTIEDLREQQKFVETYLMASNTDWRLYDDTNTSNDNL